MNCFLRPSGDLTGVVVDSYIQLWRTIAQFGRTGLITEVANGLSLILWATPKLNSVRCVQRSAVPTAMLPRNRLQRTETPAARTATLLY